MVWRWQRLKSVRKLYLTVSRSVQNWFGLAKHEKCFPTFFLLVRFFTEHKGFIYGSPFLTDKEGIKEKIKVFTQLHVWGLKV